MRGADVLLEITIDRELKVPLVELLLVEMDFEDVLVQPSFAATPDVRTKRSSRSS